MTSGGGASNVAILATLDTKRAEAEHLARVLEAEGIDAVLLDMTPDHVLQGQRSAERGETMSRAAAAIRDTVVRAAAQEGLAGIVALGGASGAALAAGALTALPYGTPKVLVSPIASGDTRPYVGASDVVTLHPVIDFIGRNRYVDSVLERAAHILIGMLRSPVPAATPHEDVGITAFGVTSPLVDVLRERLGGVGRHAVCFSANGAGGAGFEGFVRAGRFGSVIDATISELADELFGGVLSAGRDRLTAAAERRVPQIVLPGAADFLNFGPESQVPASMRDRPIIRHTPSVTLVRTTPAENEQLGAFVGERLRDAPATVVVPTQGYSLVSAPGAPFADRAADDAFLAGLRTQLPEHRIRLVDAPINDDRVADEVMTAWSELVDGSPTAASDQ